MKVIDVNAAFGFWPIQRFSNRSLEVLDAVFEGAGIDEVWLSAIESILFPEPDTYDEKLFRKLTSFARFRAVKTVNPLLANWKKRCLSALTEHRLAALKLFPNYHGYDLGDDSVHALCVFAQEQGLPILIQMRVNDERNQPGFLQVGGVSPVTVAALSREHPRLVIIALCAVKSEVVQLAVGGSNLLVDISFLDGARMLENQIEHLGEDRLVFGSHEAFFHVEAAKLKLRHSRLSGSVCEGIASGNLLARLDAKEA